MGSRCRIARLDMTPSEAKELIGFLVGAFNPRTEDVSALTLNVWQRWLEQYPVDLGYDVCVQVIATCKWRWPTIAYFQEALSAVSCADVPDQADAWGEVSKQIRLVGSYGRPEFSHPLIKEIVTSMGWQELCQSESPSIVRAQFLRLYEARSNRIRQEVASAPASLSFRSVNQIGKREPTNIGSVLEATRRSLENERGGSNDERS